MTDEPSDLQKKDSNMHRRSDNVGQSGRWRKPEESGERSVSQEENLISSTPPSGRVHENNDRRPNDEKPNATGYEGRYAERGNAEPEDNKAKHSGRGYADAGGHGGDAKPPAGSEKWEDQAGAGYGEQYGAGRKASEPSGKGKAGE